MKLVHLVGFIIKKCIIKGKIDGTIEVTVRRGRRRKQLLGDFMEKRGYWKLIEEALGGTVWRTGFGRGCGYVVRQTAACVSV